MSVRLDLKDFRRFVNKFSASAIIELHASTLWKEQVSRHRIRVWVATLEEFTERTFAD